jgi:hypothetical protein
MNVSQDGPSNSDLGSTETVTRSAIVPWLLGVGGVLPRLVERLGLGDEIAEVVGHRGWSRVVYLIEHRPDVATDFEVLEDR